MGSTVESSTSFENYTRGPTVRGMRKCCVASCNFGGQKGSLFGFPNADSRNMERYLKEFI